MNQLERVFAIEAIKSIISLGNNYRHPLYFDVQIVTNSSIETGITLTRDRDRPQNGRDWRRRRIN